MMKTDRECQALKVKEGRKTILEVVENGGYHGLTLGMKAGCKTKTWFYRYTVNKKTIKIKLGDYPKVSLAKARQLHIEMISRVKNGNYPKNSEEGRNVNQQNPTLNEFFEKWINQKTSVERSNGKRMGLSDRTVSDYRNIYKNYLKDDLGEYRVCDIFFDVLNEHYHNMKKEKGSPEGLRKTMGIVNQIMDEAKRSRIIKENPTSGLKPRNYGATPSDPRERSLNGKELTLLWKALDDCFDDRNGNIISNTLSTSIANAIRIIILTGVRREEAATMEWSHINGNEWIIPNTKNGKPHTVTLCSLFKEIIDEQRKITNQTCRYVFESSVKPEAPVSSDAITRALKRLQKKKMRDTEAFNIHDLRRSVSNGCGVELNASIDEIEHLLNHKIPNKLLKTYQGKSLRQPEKLASLYLRWGEYISKLVGKNKGPTNEEIIRDNVIEIDFGKV